MSAFSELQSRIETDPFLQQRVRNANSQAKHWADNIPLLHAFVAKDLPQMVIEDVELLPSSNEWSSRKTLETEDAFDLGRSLYFYAGRAYQKGGGIVLIMMPAIERSNEGGATPFDTGGFYHKDPKTGKPWIAWGRSDDLATRKAYVADSTIPLTLWRREFERWVSVYFHPIEDYLYGRPCEDDSEGVYCNAARNSWRAWTWEIRMLSGVALSSTSWWSASEKQEKAFAHALKNASQMELPFLNKFKARRLTREDNVDYCVVAERKVGEILNKLI